MRQQQFRHVIDKHCIPLIDRKVARLLATGIRHDMPTGVDVHANILRQRVDGMALRTYRHGIKDLCLGPGQSVDGRPAGTKHTRRVALHERPQCVVHMPETGLPRLHAIRQVERRNQVAAQPKSFNDLLVPVAPGHLDIQLHDRLITDRLNVPGVSFAQSLSAAISLREAVLVAQEPAERERQRDTPLRWLWVDQVRQAAWGQVAVAGMYWSSARRCMYGPTSPWPTKTLRILRSNVKPRICTSMPRSVTRASSGTVICGSGPPLALNGFSLRERRMIHSRIDLPSLKESCVVATGRFWREPPTSTLATRTDHSEQRGATMRVTKRQTEAVRAYVEDQAHEQVVHLEKTASELVGPVRHDTGAAIDMAAWDQVEVLADHGDVPFLTGCSPGPAA